MPDQNQPAEEVRDRPPITAVIAITVLLAVATLAQIATYLWTAFTWPPATALRFTLRMHDRIRPTANTAGTQALLQALPGWPSSRLQRALERIAPHVARRNGEQECPDRPLA